MRNRLLAYTFTLVATAVLLPALALAQNDPPTAVATTAPKTAAELAERLAKVLPTILPVWAITESPRVCDRTCLAQDLPQEAPLAATYDFQWSLTVRLMPTEPHQQIEARIFCMGEDLDAFGLFAHSRDAKTVPGQIAAQSFWAGNDFHIWRGVFYLRLVPASGDKLLRAAVIAAGEAIAAQVPLPDSLPAMMQLLPQVRNVPSTLRYQRQDALGQAALGDGLVDTYLEDGDKLTLTLALLRATSEEAATPLYCRLVGVLEGGEGAVPVPDLGRAATTFSSPQYGLCYVMREGRYVAVALGVHDRSTAEGLLRIVGTNIRISRF